MDGAVPLPADETQNDASAMAWLASERAGYPLALERGQIRWDEVTPRIAGLASRHGVVRLVATSDHLNLLPDAASDRVKQVAQQQQLAGLRALAIQQQVVDLLAAVGVPALVIKGLPFSQVLYGDWMMRGVPVDLDLLVAPESLAAADQALVEAGFDAGLGADVPLTGPIGRYNLWLYYERGYASEQHGKLDLHWRPLPGHARWNTFASAFADRTSVDLPSGPVSTLGPIDSMVMTCKQGDSQFWSPMRRLLDAWKTWQALSGEQREAAAARSPLVSATVDALPDRMAAVYDGRKLMDAKQRRDSMWRARAGSSGRAQAYLRAALGKFVPPRTVARVRIKAAPRTKVPG